MPNHNETLTRVKKTLYASLFLPFIALASSHREAPNITTQPKVDATDFYMFNSYERGREGYVTLIANYQPLQDAYGGPNYFSMDPRALYEIHVDNDGDAKEDISFQFRFANRLVNGGEGLKLDVGGEQVAIPLKNIGPINAADQSKLNFVEQYAVDVVYGGRRKRAKGHIVNRANGQRLFTKPFEYIGNKTFTNAATYQNYAKQFMYAVSIPGCAKAAKLFVGQRKESFVVNLGETFDLVNNVPIDGDSIAGAGDGLGFPSGITQNTANNDIRNKNITTLALEIHQNCLVGTGNGVIGAWTTASLRQVSILNPRARFDLPKVVGGAWTQVSRLSAPLVNELVIGIGDKDRFNSSHPRRDAQFSIYVTHPTLPSLLSILFLDAVNQLLQLPPAQAFTDLAPSHFPRRDLVATFLTGFKDLNQQSIVTPAEMLRLNTAVSPVPIEAQNSMGVIAGDLAGFPNGRRPGDDVVDIALRVVMGRLCHPIEIAKQPTQLGFCAPLDAPVGTQAFTDGAPLSALAFDKHFPYLVTPVAGSPN